MRKILYTLVCYKKQPNQDWSLVLKENLTAEQYLAEIVQCLVYFHPKLSSNKIYNNQLQFEAADAYSETKHLLRWTVYETATNKEVSVFWLNQKVLNKLADYNEVRKSNWYQKRYSLYSGIGPVPGTGKKKNLKYYKAQDRNIATGRFLKEYYIEDEYTYLVKTQRTKSPFTDPYDYDLRSTTGMASWKLKKRKQWH